MFEALSTGTRIYQKGETILRQGNTVNYLYFLESGDCYRSMTTDKGDTIIYEIKQGGQSFASLLGVLNLYNRNPVSSFSFEAKTTCVCQCIPADAFRDWAESDPKVMKQILIHAMEISREVREAFQSYQEGRIANRLCRLFLNCSEKNEEGQLILRDFTLSEFASMLGVHPVTVSRITRVLCQEKVLQKERGSFYIRNQPAMEEYAANKRSVSYR